MKIALGIEIGGTKLQAATGQGNATCVGLTRAEANASQGADGIRAQIPQLIEQTLRNSRHTWDDIHAIGVGFGGPVDSQQGITLTSHQVEGWDNFPLQDWLAEQHNKPVVIQNDASIAGYAEAKVGAGTGKSRVFYITIGSGIGGGWIVDGKLDQGQGHGAAELGHTWVPDPETGDPEKLELICSGWSIARRAREALEHQEMSILQERFAGRLKELTAKDVYQAAQDQDMLAGAIIEDTCDTLAIAICNMVALLNPETIVIGGGVSLMGDLFWDRLDERMNDYIFVPFAHQTEIVPAQLGEEVVVAGAILAALELNA